MEVAFLRLDQDLLRRSGDCKTIPRKKCFGAKKIKKPTRRK